VVASVLVARRNTVQSLDVISRFSREVDENCTLLGYYAVSGGNSSPTSGYNLSVPPSTDALEDGADKFYRHFGKELTLLTA